MINLKINLMPWLLSQTQAVLEQRREIRTLVGDQANYQTNLIQNKNNSSVAKEMKRR
jgi:hypothetical protein